VAIEALWDSGALYACACTRPEIDERTKVRAAAGDPTPGYDGYCRDLGLPRGDGRALRFRTPDEGSTIVYDLVRGEVEFSNRTIEDFICVKGNGKPLFALANVVDDRTMGMTHVFRAEEHLPNTPKQIMLWQALNEATPSDLPLPTYAHLPLLVNEQGKKISKRRDPVAVEMYREQGYLPDAVRNYLALLGWSPGEEEKVSLETMIDTFRIENVQKSPAFFDIKKLTHMNGVYIRDLPVEEFIAAAKPWVDPQPGEWTPGAWRDPDGTAVDATGPLWPAARFDPEVFARMAPVVQERVFTLSEVPAMVDFLFLEDPPIDPDSWQKSIGRDEVAPVILQGALNAYATCEWSRDELHRITAEIGEENGRALGKAQAPIRVAVTGKRVGPPLFESLEVLGRDETRRRLRAALDRLSASP
jgi:glutamyl-tRNA synthetase